MRRSDVTVVTTDRYAADAVADAFARDVSEPLVAERLGIDGAMAEWVVIGVATIQSLGGIIAVISGLLDRNRVRRIRCGEYEVENPTPEDLAMCRRKLLSEGMANEA